MGDFAGFQSPFRRGAGRRRGRQPTLQELRQREFELTQQAQAFGAPAIEEDRPGIFARIIDVLSRPNFAVAGFTEELLNNNSVTGATARAMSEIFSGLGGIQGQKRAFGQVLEGRDVGTVTLADVVPGLEGTWVGALGSRGAAGIALDILTDPLTYMTFGTGAAAKLTLPVMKGGKFVKEFQSVALNKRGMQELGAIRRETLNAVRPQLDELSRDAFSDAFTRAHIGAERKAVETFVRRFGDEAGEISSDLVEQGGVRFLGQRIPVVSDIPGVLRPAVRSALNFLPERVSTPVIQSAKEISDGARKVVNGLFHPFNELGNLPQQFRPKAIQLKRDFVNSKAAISARLRNAMEGGLDAANGTQAVAPNLRKRYEALAKKDPEIGKKFYDVREGTTLTGKKVTPQDLSPEELRVFDDFVNLHDSMRDTLVQTGLLTDDQVRRNYFFHRYKNAQDLEAFHFNIGGRFSGDISESFFRERAFDTYQEAVEESRRLNGISEELAARGVTPRAYPVLEPEFDLLANTSAYVDRYADSLARKAWREDAVNAFGRDISPFDNNVLYDSAKPVQVSQDEFGKITVWMGDNNFRQLEEEFAPLRQDPLKGQRAAAQSKLFESARKTMKTLSPEGKREFMRQLITRSNSTNQLSAILGNLWDDFKDFFPSKTPTLNGEVEGSLARFFGDGARYVARQGSFYGDNGVMLPKIIADDLEKVNSTLLNTQDHKAFGTLLKGFDFLNNTFKLGVYTFWPASAVRDAYSNVALSMLDVGLGALDPKMHRDTIKLMAAMRSSKRMSAHGADVFRDVNGVEYSIRGLARMARDFNVDVPGEVFAELTGSGKALGEKLIKRGTAARGLIENEARVQLWLNNIRRGLSPRDAADKVGEFLFNYGEVSQVERQLFRRLIPFYTFTRKNVERQWKTLTSKPGMAINQIKPFRQRNDEAESMVKWEAEALGIRLNRDGKTVHAIQGIDLPLRNLDTLYPGTIRGGFRRVMGMLTPALKVPIEVTTGRDFFTGADMKRSRSDTLGRIIEGTRTPKAVRDWIGFRKDVDAAGRPTYTFDGVRYNLLVRSWIFSRFFSTSDRQFREYLGDANFLESAMDVLTGLRPKDMDLGEQERRKLLRRVRQLEDALERRGVRRGFRRTFTPRGTERAEF